MDQQVELPRKKPTKGGKTRRQFSAAFKIRAVKLHLEEGHPISLVASEIGVLVTVLGRWVKRYREQGEAGFCREKRRSGSGLHREVKARIVTLKQEEPERGVRRISDVLRRVFFLKASPESVRRTLHEASLLKAATPRKRRDVRGHKPRFFERSTPNQLWQTDICVFKLGGKLAYLIGFIDDYSRYIVGLDLYMTQTADNVLEVYRRAASEYRPPKEMLTDNGRQYASWRGTTKFEGEMKKDMVQHIKSRPHHPMTLGKIERFWKTILEEFLCRAKFESFEEARERVRLWVKYYNFKRPHQAIEGLYPADRYFEVANEVRKVVEQGVQENVLELALRGKPQKPFYLVGRMDSQTVMLTAEKGKLKLRVEDMQSRDSKEVIYPMSKQNDFIGDSTNGKAEREGQSERNDEGQAVHIVLSQCDGPVQSGAVGMDGAAEAFGGVPGDGLEVDDLSSVAETCTGRDASGIGATGEPGPGPCFESEVTDHAGKTGGEAVTSSHECGCEAGQALADITGHENREEGAGDGQTLAEEVPHAGVGVGEKAGDVDFAGTQRETDSTGGCISVGRVAEDLLRVGNPCPGGDDGGAFQRADGPSCATCRYRKGGLETARGVAGEGSFGGQRDSGGTGSSAAV